MFGSSGAVESSPNSSIAFAGSLHIAFLVMKTPRLISGSRWSPGGYSCLSCLDIWSKVRHDIHWVAIAWMFGRLYYRIDELERACHGFAPQWMVGLVKLGKGKSHSGIGGLNLKVVTHGAGGYCMAGDIVASAIVVVLRHHNTK